MSESFAVRMQGELTVNPTDLKAMEHLIMSGGLSPTDLARRLGAGMRAVPRALWFPRGVRLVRQLHLRRTGRARPTRDAVATGEGPPEGPAST